MPKSPKGFTTGIFRIFAGQLQRFLVAKQKQQKKLAKLRNKFRLVVMNIDSFEERFSLVLSPLNIFTWGGLMLLSLIVLVVVLIAFTPLREWIPGYLDEGTRKEATYAALQADSLANELRQNERYLTNLQLILSGENPDSLGLGEEATPATTINYDTISGKVSQADKDLREQLETALEYDLVFGEGEPNESSIRSFTFFSPIRGVITSRFDPQEKHFGIDVTAPKDEPIKAALDGTVIMATWTYDTGHIIQIQHPNNLVSVYKHNSVLLREVGDHIKAGDPVAIIGETGELSTGPHLHFELWFNGRAINPENYIVF